MSSIQSKIRYAKQKKNDSQLPQNDTIGLADKHLKNNLLYSQ